MRKYLLYILIPIILGTLVLTSSVSASESNHDEACRFNDADEAVNMPCINNGVQVAPPKQPAPPYTFLAPLPCAKDTAGCNNEGKLITFDPGQKNPLGGYLNLMITIIIGLAAVMSVVMIIIGGMQYVTSELGSSKEAGKERIRNALLGLLIALGSYALLNTINPDLLITEVKIDAVTLSVLLEPEIGVEGKTVTLKNITTGQNITLTAGNDIVSTTVFGKGIQIYKGLVPSLKRIEKKWKDNGGQKWYQINTIGGYAPRDVTGKPGFLSAHAFGLALDINEITNPYSKDKVPAKTDMVMPNDFKALFMNEGWGWGGNWENLKDPMHFSALGIQNGKKGEGGDNKIESVDVNSGGYVY